MRRRARTRTSPWSSSVQRAGRKPGAASRRRRRSSSAPPALTPDPARRAERALDASAGEAPRGSVRSGGGSRRDGGGRTRRRAHGAHGSICCTPRSRSRRAAATRRPRCCSPPLAGSSDSTSRSPVRPTWTPSRQRSSPAAWRAARACGRWATRRVPRRRRSGRGCQTGCWMPLPCVSTDGLLGYRRR